MGAFLAPHNQVMASMFPELDKLSVLFSFLQCLIVSSHKVAFTVHPELCLATVSSSLSPNYVLHP